MTRHHRTLLAALAACLVALVAMLVDAARLRHDRATLAAESTRALGLGDLALSSNARWLRHPSQAEPGAALADTPVALDVEPAGGVLLPPRALHRDAPPAMQRVPR